MKKFTLLVNIKSTFIDYLRKALVCIDTDMDETNKRFK